ncbi:hypothetical protein Tco_0775993 [Tanacetum coccineum]
MSTPVFVDLEIYTQADEAQSSRVPVPLPEDPYEAIRHAYLDGTNTKSEPFEDPIETETPESPLTVAPPTSQPESTPPTLVPILCRTGRMAVRVPPVMSSGLSTSMAEVEAMSESMFHKRFRGYEEDKEIEESLDSDSVSEDAEDEGRTAEDDDPAVRDEGLTAGDEGPIIGVESHGLDDKSHGLDEEGHTIESDGLGLREEEEAVPECQQRAVSVVGAAMSAPLGLRYGALRHRELALEEDQVYSTSEVGQGSGSTPESERPKRVSASRQPTLTTWIDPEDATPATAETEGFLTELGAQVEMQGGLIRDHAVRLEELSPALFERSLEHEQERVAVTFGALWRPVLALESWIEERRARIELAENVDSMRRGQEPRGDV